MQHVYLPGVPKVARSETPGRIAQTVEQHEPQRTPDRRIRARAGTEHDCLVALMPSFFAIGPFTRMMIAGPASAARDVVKAEFGRGQTL